MYSPVDGTVVAIDDVILNGRAYGSRIDIQPSGAPSLVVSVSHVRVDPSLVVGSPLTAGGSKLGAVVDFSSAERQALAHYTNDSGNHVVVEVHPSATLLTRDALRILFVADVFGAPGRRAVETRLPGLRAELGADFCIVNGENAAAGRGITAKLADKLLASGADVVTLGNWTWGQAGFAPYLSGTDRVIRPANLSPHTPGVGLCVHDGVAVINLLGIFSLTPFESPFWPPTGSSPRRSARHPSSSSTFTPRRRVRRSRSPATSTAA